MFKNGFLYITFLLVALGGVGCSSNNSTGEDLDISEIQEIEATGEFSEDEFFSDDGSTDLAEEKLVEEVPGLEAELETEVASIEDSSVGSADDFDIDFAEEVNANAKVEGQDLFDDLDLGSDDLVEETPDKKNVTIAADELTFDDELDFDEAEGTDASAATGDLAGADLELDLEEDLFRDEDFAADASVVASNNEEEFKEEPIADISQPTSQISSEEVADILEEDNSTDGFASDFNDESQMASDLLKDDVSIDVDYSAQASSNPAASTRGFIPVKKMKTVPYSRNGVLANAVYFVREGDSLDSIASRIYGGGSAVDFTIVNPHLKPGALKVGQKIYYNSPTRSQDNSRLLTYYEDVRMPAQTYSAEKGENIRTLSKNLLGHSRSWMEVWASNQQIESKWGLEAPYQIRYWDGAAVPAPTLAQQNNQPVDNVSPEPIEESASQASLDLGDEVENVQPEEDFGAVASAGEEPAEIEDEKFAMEDDMAFDDEGDDFMEEDIVEDPEVAASTENPAVDTASIDNTAAVGAIEGRGIARKQGGFPTKSSGLMGGDNMRLGIIGVALLLLLAVGFLVVKRRRESQNAVEMDSFDFGGDTSTEQDKTQIDL